MFAIAPTDYTWFETLRQNNLNSFVNFWTPTPWKVKSLSKGSRLYFMLKSPIRKCAGFGNFLDYKEMSMNQAWIEFGRRNGCSSKEELRKKITLYLEKNSKQTLRNKDDYKIGCIILSNCEYWKDEEYLNVEDFSISFPKEVVKLKYFKNDDLIKSSLSLPEKKDFELVFAKKEISETLITKREGQAQFKRRMLETYSNRCCISGEETPELLEAAHIQPYINSKSNHSQNGLLLRKDLHTLFDNGLLNISQLYKIRLSPQIKSKYYLDFEGKSLSLPLEEINYPSKQALKLREDMFRI